MIDLAVACECTEADLAKLSDAELFTLVDQVQAKGGVVVEKQGEREDAAERKMASDLDEQFKSDLEEAVGIELPRMPIEPEMDDVNVMLGKVGDQMRVRDTSPTFGILSAGIGAFTLLSRRVTRRLLRRSDPSLEISASLTQADEAAIAALSDQHVFWVGEYWDTHLSSRISATVSREALEAGLGRNEVGAILRGVVSGEFPAVAVPGTWNGTTAGYFEMMAGTVRNVSSNFGALNVMAEAEIERYVISAVLDSRTSDICRFMDGREFSVSQGRSQMNRYLGAREPHDVREVAGWVSSDEAQTFAGSGSDDSQRAGLASAGLALPPYHGRCRTVVIPVS